MSLLDTSLPTALPKGSILLVTGATGFIGSNVVQEALDAGYKVRGTSRSEDSAGKARKAFNNNPNFTTTIVENVDHDGAWDEAMKGVSAVIHMASDVSFNPDPNVVIPATEEGVRNILRSAAKESSVKRVVLTSSSSSALLPKPNKFINVDKWDWDQEAVDQAWAPPPYTEDRSFAVYAASKVAGEKAFWKFVEDEKPHFVAITILPNFNTGRIITSGGPTGSSIESLIKGEVPPFPPQYYIDVIDDARVHLIAAALDPDVKNDRIFTFARPFTFTEMIKHIKELRPDLKNVAEPPRDEGEDLSTVPNEVGAQLLEKWYGQKGYKTMKDSIKDALASMKV